jgi:hypothetical protein
MVCYEMGLPFFRRALEGDVLFTVVMFGTPVLIRAIAKALSETHQPTTA